MHALARNPEYRPESAALFAEELAAASPDPPTTPLPQATGTEATQVLGSPTQVRAEPLAPSSPAASPAGRTRGTRWDRRVFLALASVVAAVAIILGIALGTNGGGSGGEPSSGAPAVEPVPPASDPATQARNLSDWLRNNSR